MSMWMLTLILLVVGWGLLIGIVSKFYPFKIQKIENKEEGGSQE